MYFLKFIEFIGLAALALFFSKQIFVPLYRGSALFPMFKKQANIEEKLIEEKQKTVETDLEIEIQKERKGRK